MKTQNTIRLLVWKKIK